MRTKEEIEKYCDEVSGAIRRKHEMLKRFGEQGNVERCNEISKWISDDLTRAGVLEWVLGKGTNKEGSVTISKEEFEYLINEMVFLKCLRAAGVESGKVITPLKKCTRKRYNMRDIITMLIASMMLVLVVRVMLLRGDRDE